MQTTQLKSHLIFGSLWAFLGQVLTVIFALVSTALLARLLCSEEMGVFFLASSFIIIFSAFFQLGLGKAATRMIAGSLAKKSLTQAWNTAFTITITVTISAFLGVGIFYFFGFDFVAISIFESDGLTSIKYLVLLWGSIFAIRTVLLDIHRGFHDIKSTVLFGEPFTKLILSISLLVFWILEIDTTIRIALLLTVIAVLLSTLFSSTVLYIRSRRCTQLALIPVKPILIIALPMMIINLTNMAYSQASIWIIGSTQTEQEVALFGAALRLAMLVSTPLLVIGAVIPPIIAGLYTSGSIQKMETLLRITATISAIPAGLFLILYIAFGKEILGLIYGTYYQQAHLILIALGSAQFIYVFMGPAELSLAMTKHQNELMLIKGMTLILLIGAGIFAGRYYGALGVAIATACVISISVIATLYTSRVRIGIWSHAGLSILKSGHLSSTRDLLLDRFRNKQQ